MAKKAAKPKPPRKTRSIAARVNAMSPAAVTRLERMTMSAVFAGKKKPGLAVQRAIGARRSKEVDVGRAAYLAYMKRHPGYRSELVPFVGESRRRRKR